MHTEHEAHIVSYVEVDAREKKLFETFPLIANVVGKCVPILKIYWGLINRF